jgi:hypothetical protein
MPALVCGLAEADAGAGPIFAVQYTAGGWTLRRAAEDEALAALLREVRWDVVVLQEHSRTASSPREQPEDMYPFARLLDRRIASAGARTVLFMTWGYRAGAPIRVPGERFETMQARLQESYSSLGADLSAAIAPVGVAWSEALRRSPEVGLWADDGMHPSMAGSYLSACVFYALLSGRSPAGSGFTAALEPEQARFLQRVAADVMGA